MDIPCSIVDKQRKKVVHFLYSTFFVDKVNQAADSSVLKDDTRTEMICMETIHLTNDAIARTETF